MSRVAGACRLERFFGALGAIVKRSGLARTMARSAADNDRQQKFIDVP
jgi:hypothetical protein